MVSGKSHSSINQKQKQSYIFANKISFIESLLRLILFTMSELI